MNDLITKYRPKTFDEVIGHQAIVESIKKTIEKKRARVFLLVGPTGSCKTTLARIIANVMGAGKNVTEINCAEHGKIDDIRSIVPKMQLRAMSKNGVRAFIFDECHRMTLEGFSTLLKPLEDLPEGVVVILCTTESKKVPDAIRKGRCTEYVLKPLNEDRVFDYIKTIAEKEEINTSDEVLALIAEKSGGLMRDALGMLAKVDTITKRSKALAVLNSIDTTEDARVTALGNMLMAGNATWDQAMAVLEPLKGENPENIRYAILGWFSKLASGAKTVKRAQSVCAVMQAFSDPYSTNSGIWPLQLSLSRLIL